MKRWVNRDPVLEGGFEQFAYFVPASLRGRIRPTYDGNVVIQERDTNGLPAVTYTRGSDLSGSFQGAGGIGGLVARTDAGLLTVSPSAAHSYYHADGNGNVTALINTNQAIVAKYLYDPFGNILSQSGSLANANLYRFSSKEFHKNSGLVYYLYRYYEPNFQRWLNRDPIEEHGGISLYEFAWNDPEDYFDRFGLFVKPTGFPPAGPGDDTVVCYNGKLTIQNKNKGPDRKCTGVHEYTHLQEWLKRYGDDVCKGQKNGTTPVGGDGYDEFLRQSECDAYKAGKKCRENLLTVKPFPNWLGGKLQLQGYISLFNYFDPAKGWTAGTSWVPPGKIYIGALSWAIVYRPSGGVIMYDVIDVPALALTAVGVVATVNRADLATSVSAATLTGVLGGFAF